MLFTKKNTEEIERSGWQTLSTSSELNQIIEQSHSKVVGIFKHSTRCSISSMAKSRMEKAMGNETPEMYLLDLITYRDVSNEIASKFGVRHESPQVLLLSNGKVVYHASHGYINMPDTLKAAKA